MIISRFAISIGFGLIVIACSPKVTEKTGRESVDNSSLTELVAVDASIAWFQFIVPGVQDGEQEIKMNFTLKTTPNEVSVDSVYFRGMIAPLRMSMDNDQKVYTTKIGMKRGKKVTAPIILGPNDAGLVCYLNNERHVLIVKDLEEKEALYAP